MSVTRPRPIVPDELPKLLHDLSYAVIKNNPIDIIRFAADYFKELYDEREKDTEITGPSVSFIVEESRPSSVLDDPGREEEPSDVFYSSMLEPDVYRQSFVVEIPRGEEKSSEVLAIPIPVFRKESSNSDEDRQISVSEDIQREEESVAVCDPKFSKTDENRQISEEEPSEVSDRKLSKRDEYHQSFVLEVPRGEQESSEVLNIPIPIFRTESSVSDEDRQMYVEEDNRIGEEPKLFKRDKNRQSFVLEVPRGEQESSEVLSIPIPIFRTESFVLDENLHGSTSEDIGREERPSEFTDRKFSTADENRQSFYLEVPSGEQESSEVLNIPIPIFQKKSSVLDEYIETYVSEDIKREDESPALSDRKFSKRGSSQSFDLNENRQSSFSEDISREEEPFEVSDSNLSKKGSSQPLFSDENRKSFVSEDIRRQAESSEVSDLKLSKRGSSSKSFGLDKNRQISVSKEIIREEKPTEVSERKLSKRGSSKSFGLDKNRQISVSKEISREEKPSEVSERKLSKRGSSKSFGLDKNRQISVSKEISREEKPSEVSDRKLSKRGSSKSFALDKNRQISASKEISREEKPSEVSDPKLSKRGVEDDEGEAEAESSQETEE